MDYIRAREYMSSRLKFGMKPGLDRIKRLASMLGEPQDKVKTIHVAGTNGKGSVCAMTAAVLKGVGLRCGMYTSPYVSDYLEQFQINGENISEKEYADIIAEVRQAVDILDKENDPPTEYEINTIVAFLWFQRKSCDYAVIETGLGGLTDATNIIASPSLCVITSISLDHTNILGSTIEEIAQQKAGIIVSPCPVVVSFGQSKSVKQIIAEHCKGGISPIFCKAPVAVSISLSGSSFSFDNAEYKLNLIGRHQCENAVTAITAVKTLLPQISLCDINKGLSEICHPARFEVMDSSIPIIIDGAHNKGGASVLRDTITEIFPQQELIGIMGMLADKDYTECVAIAAPLFERIYTVTPDNPRALGADALAETIESYTHALACESFDNALTYALSEKKPIIVFGSLYLGRRARRDILKFLY